MNISFKSHKNQESDSFNTSKKHAKNICRLVALFGFIAASAWLIFKKK